MLTLVITHTGFTHEYDYPTINKLDAAWMIHHGDFRPISSYNSALDTSWNNIKYQEHILLPEDLKGGEVIWVRTPLPQKQIRDPYLLFEEMMPDYQVYLDSALIFSHGSIKSKQKYNFRGDEKRLLALNSIDHSRYVYFRIKICDDPDMRRLAEVNLASYSDFISSFFQSDLKYLILGFYFLLSSIIPLLTFMKFRYSMENGALSLLTFSFGILTISESIFFSLWLSSAEAFLYIVEPFYFLGAASLCLYFEAVFGAGYKSNLKILRISNLIILFIGFPLLIIFQPTVIYWRSIKLFFFVLLMLIIISTFTQGAILAHRGNKESRIIMTGYSALTVFGLLDILGGIFLLFPWSPGWYPWGILTLVLAFQYNMQFRLRKYSSDLENSRNRLIESQFETLKNQINPHFLFNSLNTLSSLIFIDREKASLFVRDLSKVYRFILETRDKERIALQEELTILEAYIYLVQTRFKESLQINLDKSLQTNQKEVAPLCLQMLIENAIKHNITSKSKPLKIEIYTESDNYIVVENNLQPKSTKEFSSKIGLENIISRYAYLAKLPVIIEETKGKFIVKIPLI